jgi:twitching motility protein PilI
MSSTEAARDPYELLLDIERRCEGNAAGLPKLDNVEQEWVGVGFRIGNDKLIAPMDEVKEILDLPKYTNVPGVKSWVVGVANVRGNLLPIMDLRGFMLGEDIKQRRKGRVLVINYKGFNTGLIVEEVYGMRHFLAKDESRDLPATHEKITPYVEKVFMQDSERWPVFSFRKMTQDERFAQASL